MLKYLLFSISYDIYVVTLVRFFWHEICLDIRIWQEIVLPFFGKTVIEFMAPILVIDDDPQINQLLRPDPYMWSLNMRSII